ncbi:MAG: aspartate kinase [Candidatus Melainabacteria bacterium]|nr:aspartate kinase [Candidatus Melainabacteria bacterium]
MKFGGAAVASTEQFSKIAEIILNRSKSVHVVVVVSAMGDTTDQLLALGKKVHPNPPPREQDMLVSVGERISIALLAMALHQQQKEAISFTGSQSGIITSSIHSDAQIVAVRPHRILKALEEEKIVIVAGFQGVSKEGEITTLGRGGSDTTAVALGVALGAIGVEFYKDVDGVYAEDPKFNPAAALLPTLSFDEAVAIVEKGAQVLHPRCIRLAAKNFLPLKVLSFYDPMLKHSSGTVIGPEKRGDFTCVYEGEHA